MFVNNVPPLPPEISVSVREIMFFSNLLIATGFENNDCANMRLIAGKPGLCEACCGHSWCNIINTLWKGAILVRGFRPSVCSSKYDCKINREKTAALVCSICMLVDCLKYVFNTKIFRP